MQIAIIGAGSVGTALGRGLRRAGHSVVYGLREPGTATAPDGAKVDSIRAAAKVADVVVLATPWTAAADAIAAAGDLAGKILVDVTNPIGAGFSLAVGHESSGAETVASYAQAKGARVVKAFNTTGYENMANPVYGARRVFMPIAGDDHDAVEAVKRLATDVGFDAVALGPLQRAREIEPFALLWIKLALAWGQGRGIAFGLAERKDGDAAASQSPPRASKPLAITIAGAGSIGGALARAWLRAGHRVRLALRDANGPDAAPLVALGAETRPVSGAAEGADVVVLAVPAAAARDVARSMGGLEGKVVVDCTNAIGPRDGRMTLQYGRTTSSAEELAKALPGAQIVRSFNQQGAETLETPVFDGIKAVNFVAADDDRARMVVKGLTADVGLDAVDAGPLASSRYLEPMTLVWILASQAKKTRDFAIVLLHR
jgi:predicted dinucleotide-binding enzyme